MPFKFLLCICFSCLWGFTLLAQEQQATLRGLVRDSTGQPLPLVNIRLNNGAGTISDSTGSYRLRVPAERDIRLVFSHVQYQTYIVNLRLAAGAEQVLDVQLSSEIRILKDIEVRSDDDKREEVSTIRLNPASLRQIPTPFGDFNQALASIGLGVSSNSELSSAYSVRGGNFEENLVYVNGIEIYRPFLVSAGQQEGLSFINPDLAGSVSFSSGGWQAKYGDKLSSVLNVTYKQPVRSAASASLGLLGGSAHLEGTSANRRFTYLAGLRYKASRYLLNTLETRGEYQPRFMDVQGYFSYRLNRNEQEHRRTTLSVLTALARNRYDVLPQSRETDFGTLQQAIRLFVAFEGSERLSYDTRQIGINLSRQFSRQLSSSLIFSALSTQEREFINQEGGYRLCDISTDISSPDFNRCIFVRGVASIFNYGRNLLTAQIYSLESNYNWTPQPAHKIEAGWRLGYENINDVLAQYSFTDSAGFVSPGERLFGELSLQSLRFSAYAQHRWLIDERQTLSYGARINYWNINGRWLISPRIQYAWKLPTKADLVFNAAAGVYQQPPFYRELRNFSGELNTSLKAQSSIHLIAGMDWNFRQWDRPFKLIAEAYYKYLWNVIPYDMDNLRLRYYAVNNATASVSGADFRLSGEFIPGTDSWFSLSFLSARELVEGSERGSVRRPTDQRVTFSAYFEDYLPNNPSIRVNLRLLYGSGLPFGPPGFEQLRAIFGGRSYRRLDIGFSKVFSLREKGAPLESVWFGLDILNLPGINNVISYIWVQDFLNNQYAVPNGLSQRFFNLRVIARY